MCKFKIMSLLSEDFLFYLDLCFLDKMVIVDYLSGIPKLSVMVCGDLNHKEG